MRQSGQAMIEMVVIAMVVIMLFLGVVYLNKFHDIQSTTIQAARYAAWERTVHSRTGAGALSDTQLQNQARARLFTWNRDAFKSTDGVVNGAAWGQQNAVWYDHAAEQRLIARPDDVVLSTAIGPMPGTVAASAGAGVAKVTDMLDGITGGEALPQGGLATSIVSVKLANVRKLGQPFDRLDLTLHESSAVAFENWDASGSRQAALRSRSFTLAGPVTRLNGLLGPIEKALSWIEPAFKDLHFGQVCPDIVPADRVQGARVLPAYQGGGACVE